MKPLPNVVLRSFVLNLFWRVIVFEMSLASVFSPRVCSWSSDKQLCTLTCRISVSPGLPFLFFKPLSCSVSEIYFPRRAHSRRCSLNEFNGRNWVTARALCAVRLVFISERSVSALQRLFQLHLGRRLQRFITCTKTAAAGCSAYVDWTFSWRGADARDRWWFGSIRLVSWVPLGRFIWHLCQWVLLHSPSLLIIHRHGNQRNVSPIASGTQKHV